MIALLACCAYLEPSAYAQDSAQTGVKISSDSGSGRATVSSPFHTLRLRASSLVSFESAFAAISNDARVSIIAEGVPFHAELTAPQRDVLTTALSASTHAGVADIISKVAVAYDYDSEQVSPGADNNEGRVFVLRKRYSDPNELPFVTYDEIVHSLRSVLKFLQPYNSVVRSNTLPIAWQLYDSLMPEQKKQALVSGILMTELSDDQQALARSTIGQIAFGYPCIGLQQALDSITLLRDRKTTFQWFQPQMSDTPSFGFVGTQKWKNVHLTFPLTNWYESNGSIIKRTLNFRRELDIPHTKPGGPFTDSDFDHSRPDRAVPTDEDRRLAPGMLVGRIGSTLTLRAAAQVRPASQVGAGVDVAAVTVDDAVAEKPVCVFGGSFASQSKYIEALSAVYGLEVIQASKTEFALSLPRVRRLRYNQDPVVELRKLIPGPILRSFHGQVLSTFAGLMKAPPNYDPSTLSPQQIKENGVSSAESNMMEARLKAVDGCYFPAVRRLLVLAMPLVPTPESRPRPVIDADPEALRLLAIMMLSDNPTMYIDHLANDPFPPYILHPDTLGFHIGGGVSDGKHYVMVECNVPDANGKRQTVANGGGVYTQAQLDQLDASGSE